jgi:acyl-CoA synthetase (AMP-forming)/AMP-acid ligase II
MHRQQYTGPRIRYSFDAVSEIVQRFERIVLEQPERPLIYISGANHVLTASDLWRTHLDVRRRLSVLGVGPDDLVISVAGNRPAVVPLFLACLALGAPLMPVDAGATVAEISDFARLFGAAAVVLPEGVVQTYTERSVHLVDDLHVVKHRNDPTTSYGAAVLKLTSGSTGFPKATLTTAAHLIVDTEQITKGMGIAPADVLIAAIPLSHAYGFGHLVIPLLLQGTAFVLQESFSPQQLLLDARRLQARVFPGVPYMFNYFAANPPVEGWPDCLRLLISAGARLDVQTADSFRGQFGHKIHSFYGTSEAGGITYDATDAVNHTGHVGSPLPGVTITMRADEAAPAGSGRILVHSAAVAKGYLDTQNEPQDSFVDGGFLTGDYGFVDARGDLTLTGRASAAVNVAGRKVYPAELERVLRGMQGVDDACVIAAPDARRGQQLVACVITSQHLSAVEVRRFCAARLSRYKVPRAIIFLPSMPVTPRGKTDHARLVKLATEHLAQAG